MRLCFDSKLGTAAALFLLFLTTTNAAPQQNSTVNAKVSADTAKATPHLANGHPDLNGVWNPWAGHVSQGDSTQKNGETEKDGSIIVLYDQRQALAERARAGAPPPPPRPRPAMPSYKPEFVAKFQDMNVRQNRLDPIYDCKAPGVPRIGPPQEIVQSDRKVVFIYSDVSGNYWRIVPTDGRPHNKDADPSYLGDSIGRWEGDTLVVDDTNFTDDTWLSNGGTFHTKALHVTERLTRRGDTLTYEVTVEDPNVLTEPWKLQPRTLTLSDIPIEEAPPCKDMDQSHFVTFDHH
jgi:hypothetical protein